MSTATKKSSTSEGMKNFLANSTKELVKLHKEELVIRIEKALNNKKVTDQTLTDLVNEVNLAISATAVETSFSAVSNDATSEVQTEEQPEKKSTKKKQTVKKTSAKADNSKKTLPKKDKSAVQSVQSTGNLQCPMATMFPETLVFNEGNEKDETTLVRVGTDQFTSASMVAEYIKHCIEAGEDFEIYIASFWTARHIKQYNYSASFRVPDPKKFPNDLDILRTVDYAKNTKRFWAMSMYTEAMYFFEENEFEPVEDKNPYTGEKYHVRVSNGMEFEIYIDIKDVKKVSDFIDDYMANHTTK